MHFITTLYKDQLDRSKATCSFKPCSYIVLSANQTARHIQHHRLLHTINNTNNNNRHLYCAMTYNILYRALQGIQKNAEKNEKKIGYTNRERMN